MQTHLESVGIFAATAGDLSVTFAADLIIRDSDQRCAVALLRLAGRRYANPQDVTPVEVPLTQNELAGAANLSRNSVGTMLQRLEKRGFVEVGYGAMTVRAPAALRAFVDQGKDGAAGQPPTHRARYRTAEQGST
jgi:Crp-like helix-turn-helix domain